MAAIALTFLFLYKNTHSSDAQNISVYNGYVTSIYYDQFYVNEVNLISNSSATANVYVIPKSQLSYIPVVLPEKQIDKRNSTFSQRFELYYDRSENNLICNTVCELNFRFELQQNGVVLGCPAQLFLYDNKADLKIFIANEPYGSVGDPVAQTDCLPKTGVVNKTFHLPPNKLYYIGWYVAKNVGYTIWLSANLTRINISGLNEDCSVSSQHTTCPITHTKYPHKKENISLLFNTTSTTMMDVNVTPVLVQWNLQRLTGVSAPSCIGVVVMMVAVFVWFYYCMIRTVAWNGYITIA
ncbi:PREDICTED: uncharacterized protein LOC109584210 [Amphimedon queenslandica]|uniref:Uncharacterized protein n=1 Tax=Amphimedon queenslandica TaxID=400682 RepID=A0A1X7UA37_AMPQE|nr:PREDICTED: uncharacterized protein LOC109584210 [Amphimedon queenslandica]|eukprot:XP_019855425.1 PREDICTED: uncharacterized protein LOC109584210 [Amphimedon queenslandica]